LLVTSRRAVWSVITSGSYFGDDRGSVNSSRHDPRPHRPRPNDDIVYRCLGCGTPTSPPSQYCGTSPMDVRSAVGRQDWAAASAAVMASTTPGSCAVASWPMAMLGA
jgi:hypothetical protein